MSEYTPITGELRGAMCKWGWVERDGSIMFTTSPIPFSIDAEQTLAISGSDFDRLCDSIDAVHANLEREYAATLAECEGDWIKLPVDADGEYIHIGDRMEWVRYKDDDPTVVRTVSGIGNGVFFAWSNEQGRYAQYEAHAYRHHHAPTVEDVLREFALKVAGEECMTMRTGVVEEYAAKLQLAGDAE